MGFFHRGFHSQRQIIATRHRFVDSSCRIQRPRRWGPSVTKAARIKRKMRLKFILQKELKNSDVNSLGRIVLPKKDSEAHLPSLTVKEGIQIAVREVLSPKVWFMRYRFWPNNKSRMYVLENTGEYVKQNELKCGDFVILYQDENKQLYISFQKAQRPTLEGEPNKEEKESRTGLEREHESPHAEVEDQRLLISEDMLRQQGIGFHEPSTSSNTLAVEGDLFCLDGTIYLDLSNCNLSELDILPNFDDSDLSLYDDLIDDFNQDFGTAKADPSKTAK
ncbi:B3 domain-containing transcription factor ABI3 isoform X2 [Papaver somniferum]|uniref:B3 domain-containing transcription factor ABI3 isoform X2 n=1 Tax=Papaver somniferum TaxID=3469 RepID=UPI000E7022F2|nr:B3 domain-containing transcription factor ABI3 isoform X2 [Papaver somniferum]